MVVIAIIAILAGMLLPALGKARKKAQVVSCKSNMKNLGQGLAFYTADNHDQLPTHMGKAFDIKNAYQSTWWLWQMHDAYHMKKIFQCIGNVRNTKDYASDQKKPDWVPGLGLRNKYEAGKITNYSMNGILFHDRKKADQSISGISGKITRSNTPTTSIMILEYRWPVFNESDSTVRRYNTTQRKWATDDMGQLRDHGGAGSNFTMLDGHVESLQYLSNPNNLQFNPHRSWYKAGDWTYGALWVDSAP